MKNAFNLSKKDKRKRLWRLFQKNNRGYKSRQFYFIDFENVHGDGFEGIENIECESEIYIIYTEACKKIPLEIIEKAKQKNINIKAIEVLCGSKNALDFQLVSLLGYMIGEYGEENDYYIISKDTGYDAVIDLWKKRNVNINRFCALSGELHVDNKPKVSKVATKSKKKGKKNKETTLEELNRYIAGEKHQSEILKIVNSNKTRVSINNGLNKFFKDSKKSCEVYQKLKPLLKEKNKA